jgi:hypothetical protein
VYTIYTANSYATHDLMMEDLQLSYFLNEITQNFADDCISSGTFLFEL